MAFKSRYIFWVLLLVTARSGVVNAQFRLPPFDVEVKVSQTLIPSSFGHDNAIVKVDVLEATSIYGAAHFQIGQHIGIGWLYSKSFRGTVNYSSNGGQSNPPPENASLLTYGPDLRFSTGRGKKSRFFLSVNYLSIEMVDDKGAYRQASKGNTIGTNVGWMLRLSNTVYLNIIELGIKGWVGTKSYWLEPPMIFEAKTGVTINFSKRK